MIEVKALILSDSHGLIDEVKAIVNHFSVDQVLHCGDFCVEATTPPFATMVKVRGNCDFAIDVPLKKVVEWRGLRAVMVHGHKYRVKETMLPITYLGEEENAHVVLFGHSHQPVSFMEKGRLFINPGSVYRPRGYRTPTFAVAKVEREEHTFNIQLDYYNLDFEKMTDLGGNYTISI